MEIRIRDKRGGRFIVDDVVLNGYGKALGPYGISVYITLCRHANMQSQQCWPSQMTIAERTGMSVRQVKNMLDICEELGLISREIVDGKYTLYTLLEPKKKHFSTPAQHAPLHQIHTTPAHDADKGTKEGTNNLNINATHEVKKGLLAIGNVIDKFKLPVKKKGGATYQWQDEAVRKWKELGLRGSPSKCWFKAFKITPAGVLNSAFSFVKDAQARNPETLFYWKLNQIKHTHKVESH